MFIPFVILGKSSGNSAGDETTDFSLLNTILPELCKNIPHIYVYELGTDSFNIDIIDVN